MCKIILAKLILLIIVYSPKAVTAQTFTIDHTYMHSHNLRIKQGCKHGLIDSNKIILIPPAYDEVTDFHDGYARVIKNNKLGFVNIKAEEIIPCMYDRDLLLAILNQNATYKLHNNQIEVNLNVLISRF